VFGQAADYDELRAIADRHGLWLVEDAAAASGALYKGRPAGSLADLGCFSFHGRKGITSGEGGALTTNDPKLDAHARKLHAFGIESALSRAASDDLPVPEFDELGYNYKLSDIAAAMMLVQLGRLPDLIKARQTVADGYAERLSGTELITLPRTGPGTRLAELRARPGSVGGPGRGGVQPAGGRRAVHLRHLRLTRPAAVRT